MKRKIDKIDNPLETFSFDPPTEIPNTKLKFGSLPHVGKISFENLKKEGSQEELFKIWDNKSNQNEKSFFQAFFSKWQL